MAEIKQTHIDAARQIDVFLFKYWLQKGYAKLAVSTGVPHLSAARGRPTSALLAYLPDWRWSAEREIVFW